MDFGDSRSPCGGQGQRLRQPSEPVERVARVRQADHQGLSAGLQPSGDGNEGTGTEELPEPVASISTAGWSDSQQIDYELFKAELNGMDFDLRVLKPWVRDPTFYASVWAEQSDVPEHEGPSSEPTINLYEFAYPLSKADQRKLTCLLGAVPALLEQARSI